MMLGFSRSQIKSIGDKMRHHIPLSRDEERMFAQYRIAHKRILYDFFTMHSNLISNSDWKEKKIVLAARLKKRVTIEAKLSSRLTQMNLARMHDIVGCRLIFNKIEDLLQYRDMFTNGDWAEKYIRLPCSDKYDYISHPRETGYRGIHDIFEEMGEDGIPARIEVQYRTSIQHSWATALEVWDRRGGKGAKFGLEDGNVQLFFRDVSEMFWRYLDSPDHSSRLPLSDYELYKEVCQLDKRYNIINFFSSIKRQDDRVVVLESDERKNEALLRAALDVGPGISFGKIDSSLDTVDIGDKLIKQLFEDEGVQGANSVLVSVSGRSFAKAYNNYFDDVRRFRKFLSKALLRNDEKQFSFWERRIIRQIQNKAKSLQYDDKEVVVS